MASGSGLVVDALGGRQSASHNIITHPVASPVSLSLAHYSVQYQATTGSRG